MSDAAALSEILCIVDRSGSMQPLTADAIGGFNAFLETQKAAPGAARYTLLLFDHERLLVADRVPLDQAEPLTTATYVPRGTTALNDAVGFLLTDVAAKIGTAPAAEHPERVVVAILTDGMENASQEWTGPSVKALVEQRQAAGWEFVYLAAGLDAATEAGKMGIREADAFSFATTREGMAAAYQVMSAEVLRKRRPG
jgi:hypothetical protein